MVGAPDRCAAKCRWRMWCCAGRCQRRSWRSAAGAMASFKVPRAFVVVEKLPRNAMGKVQKHLLRQSTV